MDGFEWDEAKRQRNLRRRGVDFRVVTQIFSHPVIEVEDQRRDYGEFRYRALGHWRNEYFVVIYTWRDVAGTKSADRGRRGTMADEDIRRYSAAELRDMIARGEYIPTRPDAPELELGEDFWRDAKVAMPAGNKHSVHLRLDADILAWFRSHGKGYQTRINAVLRSYMEAHLR